MSESTEKQPPNSLAKPKIGLGTVQMGMDYGITNDAGRVPVSEACRIIEMAAKGGVDLLDTAVAYGDAEEVVGRCLESLDGKSFSGRKLRVVTKTPVGLRRYPLEKLPDILRESALQSCRRLKLERLHGYLVHHVEDLLSPAGRVIRETMAELQAEGITEKIGFSAYEAHEIEAAFENGMFDMVQLPFNAADRRLIDSGTLPALKQAGVEVHARSLFLQGVLLQPAERLTGFFASLARFVKELDAIFRAAGLSRLAGLLAVAWQSRLVDRLIVGVADQEQMQALLLAVEEAASAPSLALPEGSAIMDELVLNPSLWPPKTEIST